MRRHTYLGLLACTIVACTPRGEESETIAFKPAPCAVGVYGDKTSFVVMTRRGDAFRYAYSDGRRGLVAEASDLACGAGHLRVDDATIYSQLPLKITDTRFRSGEVMLAGQLIEPATADASMPLVVLAHGSEELGWINAVDYPFQFAGRGVSAFVYDKRGTGLSEGRYSQNFPELADDLVAASNEAKRLAQNRFGRFGLFGFSQGGWIAPLAAERAEAEFIGIGYGLVVDILEEDAAQVTLELTEAGYGADVIAQGREVTDITARLAVSGYTDGLDDLARVQREYGEERWFKELRGGFSGVILGMSVEQLRDEGIPMFDRLNIDWSIKPMDVLRTVEVPQLWALAAEDREAPVATTLDRLLTLRAEGQDIRIVVYPNTDHGMREFVQADDGSRRYTRVTDTYYDLLADWAKGDLAASYADSVNR